MLSVQATELNLFLHQMGGFNSAKAKEEFQIPDEYEAVSIIAVGYEGNPDALPENLRAREVGERKRKPLSELVFAANFGEENELFTVTFLGVSLFLSFYFKVAKYSTTSRISLLVSKLPIGGILEVPFSLLVILETGTTNGSASEVLMVSSVAVSLAKMPFTSCPSLNFNETEP